MSARHRWQLIEGHSTTWRCTNDGCDLRKQSRPHPHARRWYLEFWTVDTAGESHYDYERTTPPCPQKAPAASSPS